MSATDELLQNNARFVAGFEHGELKRSPSAPSCW
jgi:hypothetical protein